MDCEIAQPHVDSFNYLLDCGVHLAALDVPPVRFRLPNNDMFELSYLGARVGYPVLDGSSSAFYNTRAPPPSIKREDPSVQSVREPGAALYERNKLYPAECRQRGLTYKSAMMAKIEMKVNGRRVEMADIHIADIPIMLRSINCHLYGLEAEDLIRHGEEAKEFGGYFIVTGAEKVIRLLIANKRNYPTAIRRETFRDKGKLFTDFAISIRCIRDNHSASLNVLHWIANSQIQMAIQYRREIFYVPLMYVLRGLMDLGDSTIYARLMGARPCDLMWSQCVKVMLSHCLREGIIRSNDALDALGATFRSVVEERIGAWESNITIARFVFDQSLLIHLRSDEDKFNFLAYSAQKLTALVRGEITTESLDNPQFQEATLPGMVVLLMIRERLENMLLTARKRLDILVRKKGMDRFQFSVEELLKSMGLHKGGEYSELTRALVHLLSTGSVQTRSGLGLMQEHGFSVIAERINYLRYVSHFRAIHRGAFFSEMRTTDVRKLRPEAWGFICPIHTPDGAPCGLLNHLTASCRAVTFYDQDRRVLCELLYSMGMLPHSVMDMRFQPEKISPYKSIDPSIYSVVLDGCFLGVLPREKAAGVVSRLRDIKIYPTDQRVAQSAEIVLVEHSPDLKNIRVQYPGLYIFTEPGRLIRPVKNLKHKVAEWIGMFEQVYMHVILDPDDAEPGVTQHQEYHPGVMFSFTANLIPFPDHNQSPRNVYQCQMGKQTMGVPLHSWPYRADQKMFMLQTPQSPLLKTDAYDNYHMDDYPMGTNAIVAVIAYTGYDMEDAMVINRASWQRGLCTGMLIKVERINLTENAHPRGDKVFMANRRRGHSPTIDVDGLPIIGRLYREGEVYYSTFSFADNDFKEHRYHSSEPGFCSNIRVMQESGMDYGLRHILIQWKLRRDPIIGDKFASRHGQKGINSFLWPPESLPFSESGMVPDILFNPHGFPSRMTIGMLIESMAGKAAAMHGDIYDASPFVFNEENTAIDHFGKLLQKAGFNHMGYETMYSGVDGREMKVQIFFGVVYYQRLRHMIADKFQVRGIGASDPVTMQPVKGRKKGGGIRFGEMERDAMIAHGAAACIQDRLYDSSDCDKSLVCAHCGTLVSVYRLRPEISKKKRKSLDVELEYTEDGWELPQDKYAEDHCALCLRSDGVYEINLPRVFRFLCAELSAVNIRVDFGIRPADGALMIDSLCTDNAQLYDDRMVQEVVPTSENIDIERSEEENPNFRNEYPVMEQQAFPYPKVERSPVKFLEIASTPQSSPVLRNFTREQILRGRLLDDGTFVQNTDEELTPQFDRSSGENKYHQQIVQQQELPPSPALPKPQPIISARRQLFPFSMSEGEETPQQPQDESFRFSQQHQTPSSSLASVRVKPDPDSPPEQPSEAPSAASSLPTSDSLQMLPQMLARVKREPVSEEQEPLQNQLSPETDRDTVSPESTEQPTPLVAKKIKVERTDDGFGGR